jgi:isoleucyl-tRNA synthetase
MVDADREKISKSKQGGYEKPQTAEAYVKKYGADVVRLWVASQDFRNDIVVSEERINKVGETYRGIRNALRYQLSNLYDFDPAKHAVADEKLTGLDRWILGEFSKMEADVIAAYDKSEFHVVYQKLSQFVAVELSSIYHDVIKDRCYTDAANSLRRRSTQTALHRLVTGLCQMLAPILAYTADEAWEFIPGKATESVHESQLEKRIFVMTQTEEAVWKNLIAFREFALPKLEEARQQKLIGKSLDASITISGRGENAHFWKEQNDSLKELLNVSQLSSQADSITDPLDIPSSEVDVRIRAILKPYFKEAIVEVSKADGQKCERCWHWETDIGQNVKHPTLCNRCVGAILATD